MYVFKHLLLGSKPRLDFLNLLSTHMECLSQYIVWHRWCGCKQCGSNGLCAWQLAVKCGNHSCRHLTIVLLKMHQPFWEHKYLTLLDGLGNEHICSGYEPHIQFTFQNKYYLRGTWMRVRWVKATGSIVNA